MSNDVINFVGQLYDVRTRRDGGGRIQIDFGADAMDQIIKIQKLNACGDTNLAIAIVPYRDRHPEEEDQGSADPNP